MAQGDEFVGAFGGLDAREARDGEQVALGGVLSRMAAASSPDTSTKASATATRRVTGLSPTSTMEAAPEASMCESFGMGSSGTGSLTCTPPWGRRCR
ncbi:MAG: hypothetical protein RL689_2693 [Planctomycetota bacterium]|jgi:hypothetical protein